MVPLAKKSSVLVSSILAGKKATKQQSPDEDSNTQLQLPGRPLELPTYPRLDFTPPFQLGGTNSFSRNKNQPEMQKKKSSSVFSTFFATFGRPLYSLCSKVEGNTTKKVLLLKSAAKYYDILQHEINRGKMMAFKS